MQLWLSLLHIFDTSVLTDRTVPVYSFPVYQLDGTPYSDIIFQLMDDIQLLYGSS